MNKSFKHLPKDKRKKILLICDDIRVHSGVATVAKEIVIHTAHHFNWVQMAGAIKHPDIGKKFDLSQNINENTGVNDSSVILYPTNGYGTPDTIRQVIAFEKPDAIMLITDPRYFTYIFNMEHEIRKNIPITYLNIWDDYPAPMYNKGYYEACDLLMGISKQTVNINKIVLGDKAENKVFKYVPHGLNPEIYKPLDPKDEKLRKFKANFFGKDIPEFVVFFNSRNIRRKQIPDTMLAFRAFLDTLPKEKADKCKMVLHTEAVTDHGTDLYKVKEYFFDETYPNAIKFSHQKLSQDELNCLYNVADVQMLLTSNEGWGLTITEAILAGTPIIANVTGGMQDQMRFEDEDGNWFVPSPDVPSNHKGTYKKHGEWAFPVYPTSRSIQGSPPTPYIFDDRCRWEDATERLIEIYNLSPQERQKRGLKGREWAISKEAGFTSIHQAERVIEAFDELFSTWKPREKYELINATEFKGNFLKHKIYY
jgi:glycosyltransferase involved in cell wall biosynthesis